MAKPSPLLPGCYYHIYNRGNNGDDIFLEERNHHYFLQLYTKYIDPIAETYAYCLMKNHFHFLIKLKDLRSSEERGSSSSAFANFFSTYSKAIHHNYQRSGSLFEHPFKRKQIDSDGYFTMLVVYIHRNPQTHGFVTDFRDWPYSSYRAIVSNRPTRIQRETVLEWFGGVSPFIEAHRKEVDVGPLKNWFD
jgi:REP element-mobilizing transposase RayT